MGFYFNTNSISPSKGGSGGDTPTPSKKYSLLQRIKTDSGTEIGTVGGFFTADDNVEYALVVLDAQYRGNGGIGVSKALLSRNDITGIGLTQRNSGWLHMMDTKTATYNTQKILDYASANNLTSQVCNFCRSKSFVIDGVTYYGQLPNLSELCIIANRANTINSMDTSVSSNSSLRIPRTNNDNIGSRTWSSTVRYVSSSGNFFTLAPANSSAITEVSVTNSTVFILPILELPNI